MPIIYPANLQAVGYRLGGSETREPNVIETDTDHGPKEARREYTSRIEVWNINLLFNDAQMAEFWDWYDQTLQSGAAEFEIEHPRLRNTVPAVTVRQVGEPPVFRNTITSGSNAAPDCYWEGTWTLRVKPTGIVSN